MRYKIIMMSFAAVLASCGTGSGPATNGETIYFTGKDSTARVLSSDLDREALKDPGRVVSCADCHGRDRKGLRNGVPDFGPYSAPDITALALLADRSPARAAYDAASLRRAITEGKNPAGKGLHYPMPRWEIDGKNLDDLVRYLLTPDSPVGGS